MRDPDDPPAGPYPLSVHSAIGLRQALYKASADWTIAATNTIGMLLVASSSGSTAELPSFHAIAALRLRVLKWAILPPRPNVCCWGRSD